MSFQIRSNTSCRVFRDRCRNRSVSVEAGSAREARSVREARAEIADVSVSAKPTARPSFKTVVDERGPCIAVTGSSGLDYKELRRFPHAESESPGTDKPPGEQVLAGRRLQLAAASPGSFAKILASSACTITTAGSRWIASKYRF